MFNVALLHFARRPPTRIAVNGKTSGQVRTHEQAEHERCASLASVRRARVFVFEGASWRCGARRAADPAATMMARVARPSRSAHLSPAAP